MYEKSGQDTRYYVVEVVNPCREKKYVINTGVADNPLSKPVAFEWVLSSSQLTFNIHDYVTAMYRDQDFTDAFEAASGECGNAQRLEMATKLDLIECNDIEGGVGTCSDFDYGGDESWIVLNPMPN